MLAGDPSAWADRFRSFDVRFLKRVAAVWRECIDRLPKQPDDDPITIKEDPITINLVDLLNRDPDARRWFHYIDFQYEPAAHTAEGTAYSTGRIDMAVILSQDRDIYLAYECKRLNLVRQDGRRSLAGDYVQDGLSRFVVEQYAEGLPLACAIIRPMLQKILPAVRRRRGGSGASPPAAGAMLLVVLAGLLAVSSTLDGAVRPTPLDYEMHTLDNGLRVILSEDHSTPIVHLHMVYHVGSKNEPPGRTGFAHLFEHMMFKGSKNVLPDSHLTMISRVGGEGNAFTTEDATTYLQTVPSQYLPLVLWLEADRMATLRIDQRTFEAEREVVKEERRWRYEDAPFGLLSEILYDHAYTVHPYKHSVIGTMEDLEAASIDDVRDFYDTYYVPENATLVLVGDFDPVQALAHIRLYFGRVPKAKRPVPRDIPREPPSTAERRVTLTQSENWPLPAVIVAHHITYDGHPDAYPLHIANKVLSDGESSRIYRRLVYEDQLAVSAVGDGYIIEDPNLFYAVSIVQPGRTTAESEAALIEELDRLKTELITERELQQAKNQFARDYVFGRLTIEQKASHLVHAAVIHDDMTTADAEYDIFMNITREDVQRVARTYFTEENRLVLTILPAPPPGRSLFRPGDEE